MAFLVWCLISGRCKVGNVHAKITLQETAGQSICDWSLSNTITHTRHLSIWHRIKEGGGNRAPIWGIRRRVQADIEPTDSIMCTLTEHIFSNSWYLILLRRAAGSRHTQRPQACVFMGLCLNSWHSCVRPARTGHNQPEHTHRHFNTLQNHHPVH